MCSDCGYGNPLSFKSVTDDDIDFVEKKIKEKGEKLIEQTRKNNNDNTADDSDDLMDNRDPLDIFGEMYANRPDRFQFLRGERNFIKIIVAHVQKLVDDGGENKGLSKFKEKGKKKNEKHIQNSNENIFNSKSSIGPLTDVLYNKVINCLKSYGVDVSGCEQSIVNVDLGGAYGNIKCILCGDSNTKRVTHYQPANRTSFWVLSNFTSHLEKKHKLVATRSKSTGKRLKTNANLNSALKSNEHDNVDNELQQCHSPENEIVAIDPKCDLLPEKVTDSQNENADYSLEVIEIKIEQPTMQPNEILNSYMYTQIAEQIRKMVTAQLTYSEHTEQMEFKLQNQPAFIIHIVKVDGDGNCLFTALAHQLWPTAMASEECTNNSMKLRAAVVEHILANIELYQMFIEDRLSELKSLNNDDASLETKCRMWVRYVLSRKGIWGGIETIKAVSRMYGVNVAVFDECERVRMVQGAKENYDRTILIAYRFYFNEKNERTYNHYDSVCDMESNTIYAASEFIMNK